MKKLTIFIFALAYAVSVNAQITSDERASYNRNKSEREEWLRDLGFGMFIHWSHDSQLGVVIGHTMVGASDDYTNRFINELPKTFKPDDFDAYRIATQAKLAGMEYIVLHSAPMLDLLRIYIIPIGIRLNLSRFLKRRIFRLTFITWSPEHHTNTGPW